ncbi:MAG: peptidylprolyl isomerase [Planctomycetota bacterium]
MRSCFCILLFLLMIFWVSIAYSQENADTEQLVDSEVILEIDDDIIVKKDLFKEELFKRVGKAFMEQKISELLLNREAKRLGASVTDKEIEEETNRTIEQELLYYVRDIVKLNDALQEKSYSLEEWKKAIDILGDKGGYITEARKEAIENLEIELAKYNLTIESRKESQKEIACFQLLTKKVVKARRLEESFLKERFEKVYMTDPKINVWVRIIIITPSKLAAEMREKALRLQEAAETLDEGSKQNTLDYAAKLIETADQAELEYATEITKRLKAGEEFAKVAAECAIERSKTDFDKGWIKISKLYIKIAEAVEKLNVGEISDPVKTQYGYHIAQLCGKKTNEELTFEDVKTFLEKEAENAPVADEECFKLDAELRASANIKRNLK